MPPEEVICFLVIVGLFLPREFPTQEEMDKAVQFGSGAKFCQESEDMDILSLTDSKGKNIREYHKPDWEEEKFKYLNMQSLVMDQNLGGILSTIKTDKLSGQQGLEPFTGKAKPCLDSFAIELTQKTTYQDYWIKKKLLLWKK